MGRIALTGTSSFLGSRVLRRLVVSRDPDSVLAVDVAPPPASVPGVRYHMIDITLPAADQRLLEAFQEEEVETVVHTAFFTNPRRDPAHAHELESIGTLHLAAAAAAAGVHHLVLRSFTAVYGAQGQNPNYLTEERTPPPNPALGWIRDKLEAEGHARSFARRYPRLTVTVLRFAALLGPGVHTFYTRFFSRRLVPVLLGYDPLLQLLHPDDAVEAVEAALDKAPDGILNIVPRGVISLLTAIHLADKVPLPVPHPLAYAAADLLWSAGLSVAPRGFLDYGRFLCVADGEKAQRQLGFTARHTSRDALTAYLGVSYPEAVGQRVEAGA